ncbi:MAG: YidC/Oxa1 family membrane protein insertase [Acidimicrobiales bacterium]
MFQILAGLLAFFYGIVPNYAAAVALLTLTVMLVLTPLTLKGTRSMLAMQRIQPELKRLQQEHKGDRQKLNEAMMALYKEHGVNPVAGCLPMLLQMPVLLVMFRVISGLTRIGSDGTFNPKYIKSDSELYRALDHVRSMKAFGVDLARSATDSHGSFASALPFFVIVLMVVGSQYYQSRQTMARNTRSAVNTQQQTLMRVLPLVFGVFSISIPAAVNVYLLTSALFRIAQTGAMYRFDPKLVAHAKEHADQLRAKVIAPKPAPKNSGPRKVSPKAGPGPNGTKPTTRPANGKSPNASRPTSNGRAQPKRQTKKGR